MNIGDKLYYLKTTSNAFDRQKLTMTDAEGNTWYRYNKPIRVFEVETHTIVGKVLMSAEGVVDEYELIENSYHTDGGMIAYQSEINMPNNPYWFTDKQQALNALEALKVKYAD